MTVRELFRTDGIDKLDDAEILQFLRVHGGRKDLGMSNISETLVSTLYSFNPS